MILITCVVCVNCDLTTQLFLLLKLLNNDSQRLRYLYFVIRRPFVLNSLPLHTFTQMKHRTLNNHFPLARLQVSTGTSAVPAWWVGADALIHSEDDDEFAGVSSDSVQTTNPTGLRSNYFKGTRARRFHPRREFTLWRIF